MTDIAATPPPWYRTLERAQWKTLIAANLGWVFDGYETYALIISVGVALRQILDPASYPQIPVYAGTVIALTLLGRAIGGMVGGVVADYIGRKRAMMLGDPRLLDPDRAQRLRLGLAVLRGTAVSRGACHRVRMGDRHLDRFRVVARQESRQRCRADAMRFRHRFLPCLARVALHQPNRPRCLARPVPARRCAGAADAVDQASDPRIRQMGARERASRRRDRTQAQRRDSQRAGGVACSFHHA